MLGNKHSFEVLPGRQGLTFFLDEKSQQKNQGCEEIAKIIKLAQHALPAQCSNSNDFLTL